MDEERGTVYCGLDVHKRTVMACLLTVGTESRVVDRALQTFGTMTIDLRGLAAWLRERGCSRVAMESTGSYWKPVYNVLEAEGGFELLVASAAQVKQLRGRKTDIKDAELIADLYRQDALRPSNIPSREERELRELVRYRASLVQERSAEINRIQKVLEGANIKLASVATNVVGVSGRQMLLALINGETDGQVLARLAQGRLKKKEDSLAAALSGLVAPHQRSLLRRQLRRVEEFDRDIAELSAEIEERTRPFEEEIRRLQTIPGVGRRTAEVFLAEVGTDLARFPSAGHLASWCGVCPGMKESAGKNRSGRTPHGSRWLKSALSQAANVAARSPTNLGARHRALRYRLGPQKAVLATAHRIVVVAYHMFQDGSDYEDRPPISLSPAATERRVATLLRQLEALGYSREGVTAA